MLTNRLLYFAKKVVPLYNSCGLLRYTWNSRTNLFCLASNHHQYKNQAILAYLFLIVWILFHIFQILRFYFQADLNSLILVTAGLMTLLSAGICSTICTLWSEELFPTLNSQLLFLRRINGKNY